MRRFFEEFGDINPRIVYLLMLVVLVIPVIKPIGLPIPEDKVLFQPVYDWIENSQPGEIVFFDAAYGASTAAECHPQLEAWFYHCMKKGVKVVGMSDHTAGNMLAVGVLEKMAKELEEEGISAKYGEDWVYVGHKKMVWRELRVDFWKTCGNTDFYGNDFSTLPLMQRVQKWDVETSKGLLAFEAGGTADKFYINWADHEIYLGAAATVVPQKMTYVRSGQVQGIIPGMVGAAQYEIAIGRKAAACKLMDAQTTGHLLIVALVALGNISFVLKQQSRRRQG